MKQNNQNNSESSPDQNPISDSPISSFSEIGTPSPFFTKEDVEETIAIDKVVNALQNNMRVYTIDDLIDVWCRGVTNGATLWQYCQDTSKPLPTSFEAGLIELVNEVRNSKDKTMTLHQFINNNMMLLGVFDEKL